MTDFAKLPKGLQDRIIATGQYQADRKPRVTGPPDFDPPKVNKYHAKAVVIDGIRFPSKAEGEHYEKLKMLMRDRQVMWFCRQPRFPIEGGEYVADFIVVWSTGGGDFEVEVQDVKGFKTPVYERSKKQVKARYGIDIVEIRP